MTRSIWSRVEIFYAREFYQVQFFQPQVTPLLLHKFKLMHIKHSCVPRQAQFRGTEPSTECEFHSSLRAGGCTPPFNSRDTVGRLPHRGHVYRMHRPNHTPREQPVQKWPLPIFRGPPKTAPSVHSFDIPGASDAASGRHFAQLKISSQTLSFLTPARPRALCWNTCSKSRCQPPALLTRNPPCHPFVATPLPRHTILASATIPPSPPNFAFVSTPALRRCSVPCARCTAPASTPRCAATCTRTPAATSWASSAPTSRAPTRASAWT